MGRVLIVDDERSMREFLAICLRRAGHDVAVFESPKELLAEALARGADVVVTDLRMPGDLDGLGLLRELKGRQVDCEVVLVTAFATADTAIAAMKHGAYDYLTKPFKVDEINAVIARVMEKRALIAENLALKEKVAGRVRLASLLGRSRAMQKVFELIGKIHSTRTSVLITGESGTGKELVARALHTEGARSDKPFVAVNCGAIPEELMESELFGHVKGSFTGAHADKPGLFRQASGGTLFLDEIGELSMGLQVKLLRALQERRIKPVGAAEELEVDVRIVAATNRDLEAEVARGAFRSDLYYRLNVIELRLPPLRQRHEDVPLLVEHFIRKFATDQGSPVRGIEPAAMKALEAYDFPGNVRELENIIERAVALAGGAVLTLDDLPSLRARAAPGVAAAAAPGGGGNGGGIDFPDDGVDLDRLVYDFERAIVGKALERAGGVRKKAARLLGISFRSLRYRLDKLGFERPEGPEPGASGELDEITDVGD
jgi:two-component system response regulator PilR (NtrC family)